MEGRRLFVANIAPDVSEAELKEQFSYFGNVRFLRIIENKRIGFVEMFDSGDAYRARMGLNGIVLSGRSLRVEKAQPRRRGDGRDGSRRGRPDHRHGQEGRDH